MNRLPLNPRLIPGQRSPWTFGERARMVLWQMAWGLLCRWTPKPANVWRLCVLRWGGAKIVGRPFVHQRARIEIPWRIELHDRACVGDRAHLYSLDRIVLEAGAVVAQEAYLCCGSHDFAAVEMPLLTAPITVEARAFVGARVFVLPGVRIGARAVVGACSVVTRDVAEGSRVSGNPARPHDRSGL